MKKMKKMKNVVILFLVIILASNLLCINVNAADTCTHQNREYQRTYYTYFDVGSSGHQMVSSMLYLCKDCKTLFIGNSQNNGIQSHTMVVTDEHWHSGTMHYRQRECTICGYTDTTSWKCSGNPCVIAFSIREQLQTE